MVELDDSAHDLHTFKDTWDKDTWTQAMCRAPTKEECTRTKLEMLQIP